MQPAVAVETMNVNTRAVNTSGIKRLIHLTVSPSNDEVHTVSLYLSSTLNLRYIGDGMVGEDLRELATSTWLSTVELHYT
jgi:hypothetical protein